ncbi:hypothetical protein N8T08_005527 [Aspergillus melleus]|uniref:Uncharacterized protein n=1 Tax=Aspergillus melleus TaxID=138277 RepID=A0ACC3B3B5_9EURO|nr:hypothetical protein N8T08_005527 [Aspergillus melleus]
MAETGQDRGTMASFLSEGENDTIEALVQLSQGAPIVFEGNPEDGNTSNDREATVFQPRPQSGPAQSLGAPAETNRVDLPTNEQSAAEALDLNEEIYGPSGRPDRSEERAIPVEEDPGISGAMEQEFFDMEVDQGESSAGPTTQAGAGSIQNQHRHTTRHQRILPKPTRDSPHRRSSNTVRAARTPRHHTPKPIRKHPHNGFDILAAFTDKLEMACMLAEHLEPSDLLNLYACSKNWNAFITTYPELIILERSINQAPESARVFPFRCYPLLCKPKPKPSPKNELGPSFPWLSMIMDRERTVQSIMQWMQRTSYEVPTGSGTAIKKLWFLMDIPDTRRRKWTIRNRQIWSDMDLFLAGLFMMQIDSALQDEDEDGNELGAMRRLLMAQKSLSVLWGVLSGEIWQSELEVVQSYIRWRYEPLRHELKMQNILGVPKAEVGLLQYEAYGRHGQTDNKLRRPDSLVLGELKRRELDIPKLYREALALDEGGPHMADDYLRWDMAIKVTIEGSGIDWRDAVNLDRPNIS